jgi:hypothetical protein
VPGITRDMFGARRTVPLSHRVVIQPIYTEGSKSLPRASGARNICVGFADVTRASA